MNGVLKYWAPYYKTGRTSEAQDAAYCMGVRYAEMLMVALRNDADAVLVKRVIQEAYAANAATKKPSMVVVGFIYQIEEATLAGLRLFKTTL